MNAPDQVKATLDDATALFTQRRYSDALDMLAPLAQAQQGNYLINYWVARCHFMLGQYDAAKMFFERTVSVNPKHGQAYLALARCELVDENYGLAERYCDSAATNDPRTAEGALYMKATILNERGSYEEALTLFEKLPESRRDSPPARELVITALIGLGRYEEAQAECARYLADRETEIAFDASIRHVHHLVGSGQALSVGMRGTPPVDMSPIMPGRLLSFPGGPTIRHPDRAGMRLSPGEVSGFIDYRETAYQSPSGENLYGQTIGGSLGSRLLEGAGEGEAVLVSLHGVPLSRYTLLRPGRVPYTNMLMSILMARALCQIAGVGYGVLGLAFQSGERDLALSENQALSDLREMQLQFSSDINRILGDDIPVPMFTCQTSSFAALGVPNSRLPLAQWRFGMFDHSYCVGPKYHLPYADWSNPTAPGYWKLGEYYAKAFESVFLEGRPWQPLEPMGGKREGDSIYLRFNVPVAPLVIDQERVKDPGNAGFTVTQNGRQVRIAAVQALPPDGVRLRLTESLEGDAVVSYAMTGAAGPAGAETGPRGCLRDSDAQASSIDGEPLYNWCVHFELAV